MNDKNIHLALAVIFTSMAIYAGAWPIFILGAIYFFVFFTHGERQRKKEVENKIRLKKWDEERKEKERIAKIESTKRMVEFEKISQETLKKEAEETRKRSPRRGRDQTYK
ncbi:hypothetical protein H206_03310 [Candidatus Electrothrix aarhusensis]|uniref:Uncharacterized protein n=1 Tax=Candidatus Electrothrix aarhusensis TaxID=1859131 RepID=A0A3S4T7K6_9BACT|nr:hypothetical protein H206_03310 [Candidatus Electrothrix aarhusensis]